MYIKKGDGGFAIERDAHLQENYEIEEFYFSLSHYYVIHHFSILFKR